MAHRKPRNQASGRSARRSPTTAPTTALVVTPEPAPPADTRDEHGFDPDDYKWIPVRRVPRADGWSDAKQRLFIETLADTASVTEAARTVGMTTTSCYRLRRAPGAESFARAWDAALHAASARLVEVAFDRALNGVEHIIFDKEGRRIGAQRRYSDTLLMHLMRAHHPALYGRSHLDTRPAAAPALPPVAEALAALSPVTPPDPHLLMPPDELETALEVADLGDGRLPHWYRDPDPNPIYQEDSAFEAKLQACLDEARAAREAETGRDLGWNKDGSDADDERDLGDGADAAPDDDTPRSRR
ncbi:hypothetical protein AB5I39_07410 [Sphingomonas sp. MMS24-J45]|uniref:hypothetical protein n=1 Tax=Sphingomonas sp. MMS24-J45 TaxID=3238806 RepID=UPI00384DE627